ncbi:hypothetical protein JHK82_023531 [Glycine max]|uniref:Uncharacterized protein n=1 Tax=Glycine max TaxID=3847 RepID=K7LAW8_SOYBN|nr:hypothetical protein JHK85_024047 [Glycine max]KAG5027677.1 hypothetical protein JHK86_023591 [Glycine max]KAG5138800.1 hypothetical protein JHK82_023531 [Glycine max]KAH1054783.1 hypothetical protein GYH30_023517 [Glycine max]KRH46894.1 hypothetical protein GLYMA_08G362800v4 [Glycine max]
MHACVPRPQCFALIVGLSEFLYEESPDAMKSIGSAYAALAGGLGCFVDTIINNIIKSATRPTILVVSKHQHCQV